MNNPKMEQQVLFDTRFLEQYTGKTLLQDPISAIVELIANGWDAGATSVNITWPDQSGEFLIVNDNGWGMTEEQFVRRWRTLAYDRLKEQGESVPVVGKEHGTPRHTFGRNGIGRFSAFCFGKEYTVTTATDGNTVAYLVSRGIDQPIVLEKIESKTSRSKGTEIKVAHDRQSPLAEATIRAEIGKRFLTDPAFEVLVNGQRIAFDDIGERGVEKMNLSIESISPDVKIVMIDTERTDRTAKQHGIAWHVNGRLVGQCDWRGNGLDDFIDRRRIEARRYTFIVFADALADAGAVRPDWTGFHDDNDVYQTILAKVTEVIRDKLLGSAKERRQVTTQELKRANRDTLRKLTPLSREKWNTFVEKVQEECPSLSQPELQSLSGVLANLEVSHSRYGLIHKLHELDPEQLDDLHGILEDWTVDMAKIVLDEIRGRMKLVEELRAKTNDESTLEVQELQPLFRQGLWIFGPEFETIHYTSNEGMTAVIQKLFGRKDLSGSRNRPDLAVLPDSTVGFYSYPEYDDQGGEIGPAKLVILELKAPNVPIGDDEKGQCWKYVRELVDKGLVTSKTRVQGFVLGRTVNAIDREERTELGGRVRILPLDFSTVLQRADSRLLKLRDKIKSAPFLQQANIDGFIDEREFEEGELPLETEVAS